MKIGQKPKYKGTKFIFINSMQTNNMYSSTVNLIKHHDSKCNFSIFSLSLFPLITC